MHSSFWYMFISPVLHSVSLHILPCFYVPHEWHDSFACFTQSIFHRVAETISNVACNQAFANSPDNFNCSSQLNVFSFMTHNRYMVSMTTWLFSVEIELKLEGNIGSVKNDAHVILCAYYGECCVRWVTLIWGLCETV